MPQCLTTHCLCSQLKDTQSANQVQLSEQQTRVAELELSEVSLKKTIEEIDLLLEQSKHAAQVVQADLQIAHSTLDTQVSTKHNKFLRML